MNPAISRFDSRSILMACAVLAALWLALWFGGYPRPNVDDGFFVGAGIHLADTGRLANPWITGWMGWMPGVHTDKFLVQPPLYPLVLAGWLKVAGVSTASLTGFACIAGLAASLAVWLLFCRLTASAVAAWLATAVLSGWLLFRGLRPDSLGLLGTVASQWCLLRYSSAAGGLAGGLLGSAAVLSHPLWVIILIPATLLQIIQLPDPPGPARLLAGLATGISLALAALVVGLGDDFIPLLNDLSAHARFIAPATGRLGIFLYHFNVGYEYYRNLLVVGLALVCLLLNGRAAGPAALAWLGAQLMGFFLYAAQSTMILVLLAALVPLLLSCRHAGWTRRLHVAPAITLAACFGVQHTMQWLADQQHDYRSARPAVLAYVAKTAPTQVLFDATTLRMVFDYRPPTGAVDLAWAWSPGRTARWWNPRRLEPRDLWVVNPVWSHPQLPDEAHRYRFKFLGRSYPSVRSSRALLLVMGPALPAPRDVPFMISRTP